MSKAFDEWWREPFEPFEGKPSDIRDLCRRAWSAAIEAAVNVLDSAQDDLGGVGRNLIFSSLGASGVKDITMRLSPPPHTPSTGGAQ